MQRRRPRPVAETGRSCWGNGLQDASAAQGTKQTQGAATRRLPRLESSGDLAALDTRHLLCKPVCGLKAPLGLSCPAGTAVLSGSLLSIKREHLRPVKHFPENPKLSLSVQKTFLSLHRSTQKVASCRIDTESLTKNIIFCILSLSALASFSCCVIGCHCSVAQACPEGAACMSQRCRFARHFFTNLRS